VSRTYTGLVLCDGGEDRYRTVVPAGEGLRVVLRHVPEDGDLSLRLEDPAAPGLALHASDRPYGVEVVGVAAAQQARAFDLVVQGRSGFVVGYALSLEASEPEACPADTCEGHLGNEDAEHARAIGAGRHLLRRCPGDQDWLSLELPAGAHLVARVASDEALGGLSLSLLDDQPAVLAEAVLTDGELVAAADSTGAGRHLIRVRSDAPDEALAYALAVEASPAEGAVAMACAEAPALEPGVPFPVPVYDLPVERFGQGCEGAGGQDHVWSFALDAPARVSLFLMDTLLPGSIAIQDGCSEEATVLSCAQGFNTAELPDGTYYVVVNLPDGLAPTVMLLVE